MNNTDLMSFFVEAQDKENSIERILFLKANEKKYKKSNFYKQTHMPIMKAYTYIMADASLTAINKIIKFANPIKLGIFIQDTLDSIEPTTVEEFVDKIVNSLNIEELITESKNLGDKMDDLIK